MRGIYRFKKFKIKESKFGLSDSVDSDAVMFLANAVYFKEAWTIAFDEVQDPVDFTLTNGEVKKVKMMERTSISLMTSTFTFKKVLPDVKMTLVALRYSKGSGRFQMFIVMPERHDAIDVIMDHMTNTDEDRDDIFRTILHAVRSIKHGNVKRTLTMPLFSVKSQFKVKTILRKLGVRAAFDRGQFDKIAANVPLKLGSVSHAASIDVTLDGTLGAAASGKLNFLLKKFRTPLPPFGFYWSQTY